MRCQDCHGKGEVWVYNWPGVAASVKPARWVKIPCTECGGSGFTHCCEGERVQADRGGSVG